MFKVPKLPIKVKLTTDLVGTAFKKGDIALLTAYLPEDNTFALLFDGVANWFTFKETEEEFLKRIMLGV